MCEANDDRGERRFFLPESMVMEKVRLASFCDWKVDFVKPRDMARSMLYSRRDKDHTRCYSCLMFIGQWEEGDDPWEEHKKHSPDCPFLNSPEIHGNVPIVDDEYVPYRHLIEGRDDAAEAAAPPIDTEEEENRIKVYKFLNEYYDFLITRTLPKPPGKILRTDAIKKLVIKAAVYPTYGDVETRKFSFRFWPKEIDIDTDTMAEAGFFSLRFSDLVQCYLCGGGIYAWRTGDDPLKVHARFYSFCPYVKSRLGEENVAEIAAENPPPLAPDRSVKLSDEESKLLLSHPVCKKVFELKMNWELIETVCRMRVEECGFPFKNWRIFLEKIGYYMDSLELQEIRERQKKPAAEEEKEVDHFKSLEDDVMEKEGFQSLEEVKKV